MQKLISIFSLLSLSFGLSPVALATPVTFMADQITDPVLAARPDLVKPLKNNSIVVDTAYLTNMASFDLPPVRHVMDSDMLSFLQSIPVTAPAPLTPENWCAELEVNLAAPIPTLAAGCSAQPALTAAINDLRAACLNVSNPERFVLSQTPGALNESDLKTVEGMMKTAGEPMSHITFPASILNSPLIAQLRGVVRKMRYPSLQADLQAKINAVGVIAGQAQACLSAPADKAKLQAVATTWQQAVNNILAKLSLMDQQGRDQAAADRKAVEASGRKRFDLQYPSVTDRERKLFAMVLGGIYWRMRGGSLLYASGTQAARHLFTEVAFHTLTVFLCGKECDSMGADIGSAQRSALQMKGWGDFMDLGHTAGGKDRFNDMVNLTDRGRYQVQSSLSILQDDGYDPTAFALSGAEMSGCYDMGWEKLAGIDIGSTLQLPYRNFILVGTEYGEFCFGGVLSKGLADSLLAGKKGR